MIIALLSRLASPQYPFKDVENVYFDQNGAPLAFGKLRFSKTKTGKVFLVRQLDDKGSLDMFYSPTITEPTIVELSDSDNKILWSREVAPIDSEGTDG